MSEDKEVLSSGYQRFGQSRRQRNEAAFERYSSTISRLVEAHGNPGALLLECECGHYMCKQSVCIHPDDYRRLRTRPSLLCKPRHPLPSWKVDTRSDAYWLVDRSQERLANAVDAGTALHRLVTEGIERDAFVILRGNPRCNYYVQFALQDGLVFCEAVHNKHLRPEHALVEAQVARLLQLGFSTPINPQQNWYMTRCLSTLEECTALAEFGFQVLEQVYGTRCGLHVEVVAWWSDSSS